MSSRPLLETTLVEESDNRELERRVKQIEKDIVNIRQTAMQAAQEAVEITFRASH